MKYLTRYSCCIALFLALYGTLWAQQKDTGNPGVSSKVGKITQGTKLQKALINSKQPATKSLPSEGETSNSYTDIDLSQPQKSMASSIAAWESLEKLSKIDRENAHLQLVISAKLPAEVQKEIGNTEAIWNKGNFDQAIQDLRSLQESNAQLDIGVIVSWKVPRTNQMPEVSSNGADVRIGTQKNVKKVIIDTDANTGNLLAALYYLDLTEYRMTVNISTNDGQTWQEASTFSYQINDMSAVVLNGYFYVAFTDGTAGKIMRFRTTNGTFDSNYYIKEVFDEGSKVLEVAIASTEDFSYNWILQYVAILSDNRLVHFESLDKGETWKGKGTRITNARQGLDAHTNEPIGSATELVASFITTDNRLHVGRYADGFWFDHNLDDASFATGDNTSIAVFEDRIMVVHRHPTGWDIKYWISYDAGKTWYYGYVEQSGNVGQPHVAARNNGGFRVVYYEETGGEPDILWTRRRDYDTNNWSTPEQINEIDITSGTPINVEWIPPISQPYAHGVVWIGVAGLNGAYFDRIEESTLPPPTDLIVLSGYHGAIPLAWNPPSGTYSNQSVNVNIESFDTIKGNLLINSTDEQNIPQSSQAESNVSDIIRSTGLLGYNVYRSTSSGGPYTKIVSNISRQYYRHEPVANGQTYYYVVTAVYNEGESNYSNEASGQAQWNGYYITSGWTNTTPTLDGVINTNEWSNAATTNITYPGYSGTVTLYVMNNYNQLYLAVDDKRNHSLVDWDNFSLYIDVDHNREWPSSTGSSEGFYRFYWDGNSNSASNTFRTQRGVWPDNLVYGDWLTPSGISQDISSSSGNVQYEAAIGLNGNPLHASPEDKMGVALFTWDNGDSEFDGLWPDKTEQLAPLVTGYLWCYGPFSYGDLRLATSVTTQPNPPSNLTATAQGDSLITLTWQDNSDDEDGFWIERRLEYEPSFSTIDTVGPDTETYEDHNVEDGITHHYKITAYNVAGTGTSNEDSATPDLTGPINYSASAICYRTIVLIWTDNTEHELGYKIERRKATGGSYSLIDTTGKNVASYTDSYLDHSTTYEYNLFAYNNHAESKPKAYLSATTTEVSWLCNLKVNDAGNQIALTFGQAPSGTDGLDDELCEKSLLPSSPGIFDARFQLPVAPLQSLQDFRAYTISAAEWILLFQPGSSGLPIVLSWDKSTLPAGSFYLKAGTNVNVNMKGNTTSYTINDPAITSLKVEYSQQVHPDISSNPTFWNYGMVNVGSNSDKTFTIKNDGNANLNVTATSLTGANVAEFSIQSGGGAFTLAPAETRNIVVRFAPTSAGSKNAALSINSNDPDENPFVVALSGTAVTGVPINPVTASPQMVGIEFWVNIDVGTNTNPVTDLFGISFILNYTNTNYINYVAAEAGSFIGGQDVIFFPTPDDANGKVSIGISRKSPQTGVNGFGTVARVKLIADPATPNNTPVQFSISNIMANNSTGAEITLVPGSLNITIIAGLIVWPGDTNNNGIVDQADVLPLGLHWDKTGPERQNASMTWSGQSVTPWAPLAATYADANGDGTVNQADALPIGLNWNKTHTQSLVVAESSPGPLSKRQTAAKLTIVINGSTQPDQDFYIDIMANEVSNLFGLSFEMIYTPTSIIDPQAAEVGPNNLLGSDVIYFPLINKTAGIDTGKVSVGISRKFGQGGVSGSGLVTRITAHMSATAVNHFSTTQLTLTHIQANDPSGNPIPIDSTLFNLVTDVNAPSGGAVPAGFTLYENYPNPFNPGTTIEFQIPGQFDISLVIYDLQGHEIRTLLHETKSAGHYSVTWDGRNQRGQTVASGIYVYQLHAGSFIQCRKMLLLR